MPAISISLQMTGKALTKDVSADLLAGANEGINLMALQGQRFVQEQLYKGHGVRTGHLRRSIHGGLVRDLHGQIDAGLFQQGANVQYAEAVETGTRPHVIVPRQARVLAFKVNGRTVFARRVNHPGTAGLHMFANAARRLQNLDVQRFVTDKILRRLG